ncbi:MAG: hypothetical protein IJD38_00230 [Clostridia bacterium]|nr:hypothetical protein [Clostridia bacterium]
MKHNNRLWMILILSLTTLALLLCATSCDSSDGADGSDSSDSSIPADTLGSTEDTAAETTPDLSALEPAALWDALCDTTGRWTHRQIHIVGSMTVLNENMEGMDYGLSLRLSHDGELTGITMTDLNGGHAREMTYADGILYWRENGEQLRVSLNENRVATLIAAINHSFSRNVTPADVETYSNYITELPAAETLFSSITAESSGTAYTVTLSEPIVGEGEKSFFADTLQTMTVTATASDDGRLQGVSLNGLWSSEDTNSYISILPLLSDTLGMESGFSGQYKRMEWSLRMDFTYEDETVSPPVPTAKDIRVTWNEAVGNHHIIPFADIAINYGTYESCVLPADIDQCIVSIRAKEGETLSRRDRMLCWVFYRIEDGKETKIISYKSGNRGTANLGEEFWDSHPAANPSHTYLPLEPGEYKLVLHYIYTNKMGNTFEERWDIAGATTFRVMERGEKP